MSFPTCRLSNISISAAQVEDPLRGNFPDAVCLGRPWQMGNPSAKPKLAELVQQSPSCVCTPYSLQSICYLFPKRTIEAIFPGYVVPRQHAKTRAMRGTSMLWEGRHARPSMPRAPLVGTSAIPIDCIVGGQCQLRQCTVDALMPKFETPISRASPAV